MSRPRTAPSTAAESYAPVLSEDEVRKALEAAGCRFTQQRGAVYAHLAESHCHPTAEEVYLGVRGQLPRISLATVYKALEALVTAGLATKLTSGDNSARYDCRAEHHYHLRDTKTGEVYDLPTQFDPDLLCKLDPELTALLTARGFRITGYRLEVLAEQATNDVSSCDGVRP